MRSLKFCFGLLTISTTVTSQTWNSLFTTEQPVLYDSTNTARAAALVSKEVKSGCGWRQTDGVSFRITDNDEAAFGEFPWVVAIFVYNATSTKFEYWCVGSLIHPAVVLTAGRLRDVLPKYFSVRFGDWDLSGDYEIIKHQTVDVAQVVGHPGFNATTLANDATLLFLQSPVTLAPNVGLACLPRGERPTPGARCIVTGWGYDTFNGSAQNILKMVEVPIIEQGECQSKLREALQFPLELPPSALCAGGEPGKDACRRDGGAPLVCPYKDAPGRYYQAGSVSWGAGCGRAGVPAVYARVAALRTWVDAALAARGLAAATL